MGRCLLVVLPLAVAVAGCTLGGADSADPALPTELTQPVPDPPVVVVPVADGSAEEIGLLAGVWNRPDQVHRRNELVPLLVPADDRLIVLNTQNGGNDMVGEIYDPLTDSANSLGDTDQIWRYNPAVAWTGEELLVIGGSNGPGIEDHVLSHRIGDGWRVLPNPPFPLDSWESGLGGPGIWTGSELVLWRNRVAFSPEDGVWSPIAPFPLLSRSTESVIWTGTEIIVWGGCSTEVPQCDDIGHGQLTDGAAYDPAQDAWRQLATSPLAPGTHPTGQWTGSHVIYYAGETSDADDGPTAAAYDPVSDSWEILPDPPIDPRRYATSAWSGQHFYLWGGSADNAEFADGVAFDPSEKVWLRLPDPPDGSERDRHSMAWVNGHLYITGGWQVNGPLVFSPTTQPLIDDDELSRQYEDCVIKAGFDPGGVGVLTGVSGVPWWVKTGFDVPSEFHGPCFAAIGGEPNSGSSWGS